MLERISKHDFLLKKRTLQRQVQLLGEKAMAGTGRLLPFALKLRLARLSSRLGCLLVDDEKFIIEDYLGSFKMEVDPRCGIDRAILRGSHERELIRTIGRRVNPGDYCIDVGANIGSISIAMCNKTGPSGKVFCFEPGPLFFQRLCINIDLNADQGLPQIAVLEQKGLSAEEGQLFWEEDPEFPGNAFLWGGRGTPVPVTTLDSYFGKTLSRLDFLKIDVEGMEYEVLKGGARLLQAFHPAIVFESVMDFEVYRRAPIRRMTEELLLQLGYQLFQVRMDGNLVATQYPNFGANTLALPRQSVN